MMGSIIQCGMIIKTNLHDYYAKDWIHYIDALIISERT